MVHEKLAVEPADAIAVKLGRHTIDQSRIDAEAMRTADTATVRAAVICAVKAQGEFGRGVSIRTAVSRMTWRSEADQFRLRRRRSLIKQERPATITLRAHAGALFGARAQHGARGPRADRPPPDQTFEGRCRWPAGAAR